MTSKFLTLPNVLTLTRVFSPPALLALLWYRSEDAYLIAFVLFWFVAATDYFDGYLARAQGTVSKIGALMDPIADKIMVCSSLLLLTGSGDLGGVHLLPALIILSREIAVSGIREYLGAVQVSMPVTRLAKWKTAFQMVGIGGLILAGGLQSWFALKAAALSLIWIAAGLTVLTGWVYFRSALRHLD